VIGSIQRSLCLLALVFALSLSFAAAALAGQANTSALRAGQTYDRFIVRFGADTPEFRSAAARQALLDVAGRNHGVGIAQLRRLAVGADVIRTSRKLDRAAAQAFIERLARNPHVAYAELDALRTAASTPNDTYYPYQWHYFEPAAGINLPGAWDRANGAGVVVAVIDTGTTTHSDLSANYVTGYDFISDAANARDGDGRDATPTDMGDWTAAGECDAANPGANSSWHGTHVAGTIAAVTHNAKGMAGVAPNAKILPLRVLGKCGGNDSDIADAITWARGGTVAGVAANANPAEVINLSLGGLGTCGATLQTAIDQAVAAGTVVVVAAGNDNADPAAYTPASCNNVIVVGSVGRTGARAGYSNHGARVDLSAPGGDAWDGVVSTSNNGTTSATTEAYTALLGTSMATPHVSGTVALMQGIKPNSPATVEATLKSTARAFPVACTDGCGAGILDAQAAVTGAAPTLSIADVTVREGNAGTTVATFTATLSRTSDAPVTFGGATATGSAVAGSDYVAATLGGQVIPAGMTSKLFTVTINGDTALEANETFLVNLTSLAGASAVDTQAIGTIAEDDMPLSIADVSVAEGNSGTKAMAITVTLPQPAALPVSFTVSTANGTATAGSDYVALASAAQTLVAGASSKTFTVTLNGDATPEANETFSVNLAGVVGATVPDPIAVATLVNDDGPTLSINNMGISEGNSGTKLATFTVTLSAAASVPVSYTIATADATATAAGGDYVARSITDTIPAGMLSKTFTVTLNGDTTVEANEDYLVKLGAPVGATLYDDTGIGTILNDDGPTLSIADLTIAEGQGNPATTTANLTLTLSQAIATPVTCSAKTYDDTATAASGDYVASTQSVTIPAGQTSQSFPVTIGADLVIEADERLRVDYTCDAGIGATILDYRSWINITNDDAVPALSVGDVTLTEGNSGTRNATFTVSLSGPTNVPVTFSTQTAEFGSAVAGSDFVGQAATAKTIPAGSTSLTVDVVVNGDTAIEGNEGFALDASNVVGATVADSRGLAMVVNDDGPTLSIGDVTLAEGDSGTKVATFTVSLSQAAATAVSYMIWTSDGTATTADADYVMNSNASGSIPAGMTSKTFTVTINGDTAIEPNETFTVFVAQVTGASITDGTAIGTITDDDGPPALSIADISVPEGAERYVNLPVNLSRAATGNVTCQVLPANGTATGGTDANFDFHIFASPLTVTIPAGQTHATAPVYLYGDRRIEPTETILVNLNCTTLANATVLDGQAVVTVTDDDTTPTLAINDVTVVEGNSGTKTASFTVSLSWAATVPVTFDVATGTDGTATAYGADFVGIPSTTVTIPAGSASAQVAVTVNGDSAIEPNETFSLNLTNPVGATIADGKGVGTILDDDGPRLSVADVAVTENPYSSTQATFTVALTQPVSYPVTFDVHTEDGTARAANSDYTALSATGLTIPAGMVSRTVTVTVLDDNLGELAETFKLVVTNVAGVPLFDGDATGTIPQNDTPSVYFDNAYKYEYDFSTTEFGTVRLSNAAAYDITLHIVGQDDTARAGEDYEVDQYVTIYAGNTSARFTYSIVGDNWGELNRYYIPEETFRITAVPGTTAVNYGGYGTITIRDDDCMSCN
jgi:subtilisin family serine protease